MITISGVQPHNDAQQWIFLTLSVDGNDYNFTHVAPADLIGQALQEYVDSREPAYRLDILRDMYPGAMVSRAENQTELEAFEAWIAAGHKNIIEGPDGEPVEIIINKVAWNKEHPPMVTGISVFDFRMRFTLPERVAIKTSVDPVVAVFYDDLMVAGRVERDNPVLVEGMNYLVSAGIIGEARKEELLTF